MATTPRLAAFHHADGLGLAVSSVSASLQERAGGWVVVGLGDGHAVHHRVELAVADPRQSVAMAVAGPGRTPPQRALRWMRRIAVLVWLLSWHTIYREIFVWHHMTTTLRFKPPPVPPGAPLPRAGLPVIAVCATSILAPILVVTITIVFRQRQQPPRAVQDEHD